MKFPGDKQFVKLQDIARDSIQNFDITKPEFDVRHWEDDGGLIVAINDRTFCCEGKVKL